MAKKRAAMIPWANICATAPSMEAEVREAIPIRTKPMWLMDELATTNFRSFCTIATNAMYTAFTAASTAMVGAQKAAPSGKSPMPTRIRA